VLIPLSGWSTDCIKDYKAGKSAKAQQRAVCTAIIIIIIVITIIIIKYLRSPYETGVNSHI
jgi:hypothetical protein